MHKLALLSAALSAGCSTSPPAGPTSPGAASAGGECRADNLGQFAGREVSSETADEILRASGARVLRWVQPGMMITMEYSPNRITVWLAPGNRIERVSCG